MAPVRCRAEAHEGVPEGGSLNPQESGSELSSSAGNRPVSESNRPCWADLTDSDDEEQGEKECTPAPRRSSRQVPGGGKWVVAGTQVVATPADTREEQECSAAQTTLSAGGRVSRRGGARARRRLRKDAWRTPCVKPSRVEWRTCETQTFDSFGVPATVRKPQCQFLIDIEEDDEFHVVRRLLGPHGSNMKRIAHRSGVRLRLRGRGSKFLEGPEQQESQDQLMLCVSAPSSESYKGAGLLVHELIQDVYEQWREFCEKSGQSAPELQVRVHEGPRAGAH